MAWQSNERGGRDDRSLRAAPALSRMRPPGDAAGPAAVPGRRRRAVRLRPLPPPRTPAAAALDEFEVPDLAVGFYDWVVCLRPRRRTGPGSSPPACPRRPHAAGVAGRRAAHARRCAGCSRSQSTARAAWRSRPAAAASATSRCHGLPGVASNFDRAGYLPRRPPRPSSTSTPATASRSTSPSGCCTPRRVPPLELYGRLRSATRPRSPATSTWATSSSPAPRRSASCASTAARSRRGRSRAPGRAARRRTRTRPASTSCSPAPRTGPRTS